MISNKSVQEVFSVAQVHEIIEEYVNLKRRGSNFIGLCPFHDEKTPSFSVSPSKNIYKCFGCGKGGGPVQFLMEHNQLSFPEAIRNLAAKYNITLEEDDKENNDEYKAQKKLEESYYIINTFANEHFKNNLLNDPEGKQIALSYFKERGFLQSTIENFELGYALKGGKRFVKEAELNQYNLEFLRELGLSSKSGYDFFRERVMFPIHNVSGKVVAFAGRILTQDKKQPKYINSPETPIYNKSKTLYALHLAKAEIRKKDNCIIVEGYTDVISLHQNNITNVVASSGTALTQEQVRLIKRYTENITLLYDSDSAGIKASLRGLDIVLENGMNAFICTLPEGEDPDSFVNKNGNSFVQNYLSENSKNFIDFKLSLIKQESADDPIKMSEAIQNLVVSLAKVRDPIKRSLYLKKASQKLDMKEAIMVKAVNKQIREQIKVKDLQKKREDRLKQKEESGEFPPPPQEYPPYMDGAPPPPDYHEIDEYPEEKIKHEQSQIAPASHEYQEKDLARIVVNAGDKLIVSEDGEEQYIAEFIFTNISDVIQFFDNLNYKDIITKGFEFVELESSDKVGISDYFVNHENEFISKFAVDALSSPYEFAKWNDIGVYLNQKMPESNYYLDSLQSIQRFKLKKLNKVLVSLKKQMTEDGVDAESGKIILKMFKKLQLQKKELAELLGVVISPS